MKVKCKDNKKSFKMTKKPELIIKLNKRYACCRTPTRFFKRASLHKINTYNININYMYTKYT